MISYSPTTGRRVSSMRGYGSGKGLRGSAAIQQIQEALTALAQATGDASLNPGIVSGEINTSTALAMAAAVPRISLSIDVQVAILDAAVAYSSEEGLAFMSQTLESYSPQIIAALRNAAIPPSSSETKSPTTRPSTSTVRNAIRVIQSGPAGQMPNMTRAYTPPPAPRVWYKQKKVMIPAGIGVAFLLWRLL